jgi:uncharacterized protein (TIGR03435 family)
MVSDVASAIPALSAGSGPTLASLDSPVRESARGRFGPLVSGTSIVRTVWMIGALIVLVRLVAGLRRLRTLRTTGDRWNDSAAQATVRQTTSRRVHLFLHPDLASPMTCGFLRPAIGLPIEARDWPTAELRQALIHEIEHVRRADWLVMVLAKVACGLYWFHPLTWMAARRLHLESEYACDDAVVRVSERASYAQQLVSMARRLSEGVSRPALSMAERRDLARRVDAVLNRERPRAELQRLTAAISAIAALVITLVIAPWRPVAILAHVQDMPPVSNVTTGKAAHRSVAALVPLTSQAPLRFEVVSIKPNNSLAGDRFIAAGGSQFRVVNLPLKTIINYAYDLRDLEIVDAPQWTTSERFDITATYPGGSAPSPDDRRSMLQRVLAERFGLRIHRETRELPIYRLVKARDDGRLGPALSVSDVDCVKWLAEKKPQFVGTGPVRPGGAKPVCMIVTNRNYIIAGTKPLSDLALGLESIVERRVVDATGLTGNFDITVRWTDAQPNVATANNDAVSVFTALQEQLGLKLEPSRGPVDVVVIDSAQRPTPD